MSIAFCALVSPVVIGIVVLYAVLHANRNQGGVKKGLKKSLRIEDQKFLDKKGRQVLFRGVNVVYKDAPYFPIVKNFHSNLSFVKDDVDLLQSLGVNMIRLGVMWPGVSPAKGIVNKEYL